MALEDLWVEKGQAGRSACHLLKLSGKKRTGGMALEDLWVGKGQAGMPVLLIWAAPVSSCLPLLLCKLRLVRRQS